MTRVRVGSTPTKDTGSIRAKKFPQAPVGDTSQLRAVRSESPTHEAISIRGFESPPVAFQIKLATLQYIVMGHHQNGDVSRLILYDKLGKRLGLALIPIRLR